MYILILYATLIDAMIRLFNLVSREYDALERLCMTCANFIVLFMFISLIKNDVNMNKTSRLSLVIFIIIVPNIICIICLFQYCNMCHSLQNDINIVSFKYTLTAVFFSRRFIRIYISFNLLPANIISDDFSTGRFVPHQPSIFNSLNNCSLFARLSFRHVNMAPLIALFVF